MPDLKSMSLKELTTLQKDVYVAIIELKDRERKKALAEVEAFAKERGLSVADLSQITSRRARKASVPRYANPDDITQTWTGRGRRPRWLEAALNTGKSLDDMTI